jgi:hypothetical protein
MLKDGGRRPPSFSILSQLASWLLRLRRYEFLLF